MSARTLTMQRAAKLVKQNRDKEPTDPPDLGPDEMRLYSYYRPGLVAGNYQIIATQTVTSPTAKWGPQRLIIKNATVDGTTRKEKPQEFEVVVPRFSLDPKIVNSFYPPDGHQDEGRVLPHIVFNDPHYPWEVSAGTSARMNKPIDGPYGVTKLVNGVKQPLLDQNNQPIEAYRGLVPWLALIVFDPEELRLSDQDDLVAQGLNSMVTPADLLSQNAKGTFQRTVKEYLNLQTSSRIKYESDDAIFEESKDLTNNIDVIFPTRKLFREIFAYKDSEADNTDSVASQTPTLESLEALKYMAHVRHINTIGFPDAGIEEDGLFSIVVSSRLGAYNIDKPHTQVCHLVSIEHVDTTLESLVQNPDHLSDETRIGMVSLFSWIYTALPPNPINFVDTVRNLVSNQQMLCVEPKALDIITSKMNGSDPNGPTKTASDMMVERLKQGYTFSRWRTSTGEQTAAFNRGPLVPGVMSNIPINVPDCSNTSQNYQILDPQTGIMDLSYSTAWQLGKALAISDTTFSSALMRFRSVVYNDSVQRTQMVVNNVISASTAIQSISSVMTSIQSDSEVSSVEPNRVISGTDQSTSPILQDPDVRRVLQANNEDLVAINASTGSEGGEIEVFNEFNKDKSNNSDWTIIHTWLCEKLSLAGIPPQYLFPEPSYLPSESLRYFYIDNFWLDCLIDGALSVANHLNPTDDSIRRAMKRMFNSYLSTKIVGAEYRPQIPCYGFVIRSQLIKTMPDLRITVKWKSLTDTTVPDLRAPVCRWTKFDDETLICLLDRYPEELEDIVLAQPPHQQRFSLGSYVRKGDPTSTDSNKNSNVVEFDLRTLYTSEDPNSNTKDYPFGYRPEDEWKEKLLPASIDPRRWLDFDTRVLHVAKMAIDINSALQFAESATPTPKDPVTKEERVPYRYRDDVPNSCELGLELNDPSYYFRIKPKVDPTMTSRPTTATQPLRQLRVIYPRTIPSPSKAQDDFNKILDSRPPPPVTNPTSKGPPSQVSGPGSNRSSNGRTKVELLSNDRTFDFFNGRPRRISNQPISLPSALFTAVSIYADYKLPPTRLTRSVTQYSDTDYIPDRNLYFYDLIFSIRKSIPTSSSGTASVLAQDLLRVDIDIPIMPPSPTKPTKEPLLEADYYGPGVRMLSNQRFIPFMFYDPPKGTDPNGTLHIELRPRATNKDYALTTADNRTADLSFRLAEAPVSRVAVPTTTTITRLDTTKTPPQSTNVKDDSVAQVRINITEWYRTALYPDGEPVRQKDPYVLIKRQTSDDKAWPEFG